MSTYSKIPLSGSTDGRGIKVVATSIGSGTTIHTATSDATLVDNIYLYVLNSDVVSRNLTVGWGGTTSPDDLIVINAIPSKSGLMVVTYNLPLRNSLIVKAAGDAANVLIIWGYVNRIS